MSQDVWLALLTFFVAWGVSSAVTPWVIRLARKVGALDLPSSRKVHREPVPRVGGVAVFAGFVAGLAFAAHAKGLLFAFPVVNVYWGAMAGAATLLFLFGFLDDVRGLSYRWKFLLQVSASVAVWLGGFRIEILSYPFGGPIELGILSLPVTVVWVVGITNALNLIDGLDGLATGTALITTSAVAVIAVSRDQMGVAAASIALVGSLAGFLRFNFNPARIFLGDSGSMFLGFVLAVISIRGSQKGSTAVAVLAPLLALGLPVLDTGFAIVRRSWRVSQGARPDGIRRRVMALEQVFLPDRGHIHHRLIDRGFTHRGAVLALYGATAVMAAAALASVVWNALWIAAALLSSLVVAVVVVSVFYKSGSKAQPGPGASGSLPGPRAVDSR